MKDDETLRQIGTAIQAQREAGGQSVDAVAERLGWSQSRLADVERGAVEVTVLEFLAIADALGVSPATLVSPL